MDKIPPHFRSKWATLSLATDPSRQSLVKIAGKASGVTDNPDGGQTFQFANGAFISYDKTSQPFFLYGGIYQHWSDMGGLISGYGYPIADPQFLPDGTICSIFVGGHIHQVGTSDAELFPASQCPAPYKPTVPTPLAGSSKYWPQSFRQKWISFSTQRDPNGKLLAIALGSMSAQWPDPWPGLTDNEDKKGGQQLHFLHGRLVSKARNSPPILVYGKVYEFWVSLKAEKSGLGYPLVDTQYLPDGSLCSVFEGGHVHHLSTDDTQIVPANECIFQHQSTEAGFTDAQYWPASFRSKWVSFASKRDSTGKQLGVVLGSTSVPWPDPWPGLTDNEDKKGGQQLHFFNGRLVSKARNSPPILVYGKVYEFWVSLKAEKSGLGYPLVDTQHLSDGLICCIFEGGHVHQAGTDDAQIVPANECIRNQTIGAGTQFTDAMYWPVSFRNKWISFASNCNPAGKQLGVILGSTSSPWPDPWPGLTENEDKKGGKQLHFFNGRLVAKARDSPPILVFGKVYNFWVSLGAERSGLGYPVVDTQYLPDGSMCGVFEGGHVHHIVADEDAEIFPANECINQNLSVGPMFTDAMYWPASFRSKWVSFACNRDPSGKQLGVILGSMSAPWPDPWLGLTDNEDKKGGKQLHFLNGRLVSKTRDSPPILVFGKVYNLWASLGAVRCGLGYPIADTQYLPDGTICGVFQGGHVHHRIDAEDAEIVPASGCNRGVSLVFEDALYWPRLFRKKWASFSWQRDFTGKQMGLVLGSMAAPWPQSWSGLTDNEGGGKTLQFLNGKLVSYHDQTSPLLVYGKINEFWHELGGISSPLGYPLADPQFLPDGTICTVFEGGHIHQLSGSEDADIFPADQCLVPYKPTSRAPPDPPSPILSPVQTPLSGVPGGTLDPPVQELSNLSLVPPPIQEYQVPSNPSYSSASQEQTVFQTTQPPFTGASAQSPILPPPPQYTAVYTQAPPPQPVGLSVQISLSGGPGTTLDPPVQEFNNPSLVSPPAAQPPIQEYQTPSTLSYSSASHEQTASQTTQSPFTGTPAPLPYPQYTPVYTQALPSQPVGISGPGYQPSPPGSFSYSAGSQQQTASQVIQQPTFAPSSAPSFTSSYSQPPAPPTLPTGSSAQDSQSTPYPAASQEYQVPQGVRPNIPGSFPSPPAGSSASQYSQPPRPPVPHGSTSQGAGLHGKHRSAKTLVGKGMRMLGTGINRVADAIDKHAERH